MSTDAQAGKERAQFSCLRQGLVAAHIGLVDPLSGQIALLVSVVISEHDFMAFIRSPCQQRGRKTRKRAADIALADEKSLHDQPSPSGDQRSPEPNSVGVAQSEHFSP